MWMFVYKPQTHLPLEGHLPLGRSGSGGGVFHISYTKENEWLSSENIT